MRETLCRKLISLDQHAELVAHRVAKRRNAR
jgi:hypothetical protein